MSQRGYDFQSGTIYRGVDGKAYFIMAGINERVSVWEEVKTGHHVPVRVMTLSEFAELVGRH